MMNALGIFIVVAALGIMLALLRLYQRLGDPHPEILRKILHVGMGLVACSFPWLFDAFWPVVTLGSLSVGGMLALRYVGALKDTVGQVVSGVGRFSLGEVYFPLAIALQWHIYLFVSDANEHPKVLYAVPLLLLTLADAAAALVGVHYGSVRYATSDGVKSAEGSLAFFFCAFLSVHIPVLLATDAGKTESLLIAALLALVAMLFEAIAWGGLDNLVLPLVGYLLLRIYLGLDLAELTNRLAVSAAVMGLVFIYRKQTTLHGSALLGVCLIGYLCWALGGWRWMAPPFLLFAGYTYLSPRTEANSRAIHNIHAVVAVSSAGLIWLFLFRLLEQPEPLFYYLYTLAFAAQMAIIAVARLGYDYPQLSPVRLLTYCTLQGWILLFVPYILLAWPVRWDFVLCALVGVALAAISFYLFQPNVRDCPADRPRWIRQAAAGFLGSGLGLAPIYLW